MHKERNFIMAETKAKETNKELCERLDAELGALTFGTEEYEAKAKELHAAYDKYYHEKVTIELPEPIGQEDEYQTVIWNGTKYSIQKGERVEVPRGVYMILENVKEQKKSERRYRKALIDDFENESKKYS